MKKNYRIINAKIVNEGNTFTGEVWIKDGIIEKVINTSMNVAFSDKDYEVIDAENKLLIPGVIDDQVHFREPGLTDKGDIYTESRAAVAGGITSFMEMPNTSPQTLTQELLQAKYDLGAERSMANYSFYMGASNTNIDEILKTDPERVCGVKVFLGASTGNMLVDNPDSLKEIFAQSPLLVAVHCEDEQIIRKNSEAYRKKYGEDVPIRFHSHIRSEEACYRSSSFAAELAGKYNTRLHILHLSTAREMELFDNTIPLEEKKITAEVCVHHLWFDERDYDKLGTRIKWNPAIKTLHDKESLFEALLSDKIDVVATDHAPHTREEKSNTYFKVPSGGPLVQHSLPVMLEFYHKGKISLEKIVEKMCHAPAKLFQVRDRGFIREGYKADIVLIDQDNSWEANQMNIFYKCAWSPFEGQTFRSKITHTFVNGNLAWHHGIFDDKVRGERLLFNRS